MSVLHTLPQATVPDLPASAQSHGGPSWVTVTDPGTAPERERTDPPLRARSVWARVAAITVLVLVAVAVVGIIASRRIAERQAVNDAAARTDLLVETVIQPALSNELLTGDRTAIRALDTVVREKVLTQGFVRVKVWNADGRVLYSDEPRLIGQTFTLDADEREAFDPPRTRADVTDVTAAENRFEQALGRSLEVYRPVWTRNGTPLLLETYSSYAAVSGQSSQIWRGFAGITISSLLLLIVLLTPLLLGLLRRIRRSQRQREALLERAVRASDDERRRIAATVHDGVVQELVATSYALGGQAEQAAAHGETDQAEQLRTAATTVRANIGSLRSLLVDIYPPALTSSGLPAALDDLAGATRSRGIEVEVDVDPDAAEALDAERSRLLFQVTQECLRNVVKHADARSVRLRLARPDATAGVVRLDIEDDGTGFDVADTLAHIPDGHFGLRLLTDESERAGARLRVRSAPGRGTHWQLEVAA